MFATESPPTTWPTKQHLVRCSRGLARKAGHFADPFWFQIVRALFEHPLHPPLIPAAANQPLKDAWLWDAPVTEGALAVMADPDNECVSSSCLRTCERMCVARPLTFVKPRCRLVCAARAFAPEVVFTSPLTRALQTAIGVFGNPAEGESSSEKRGRGVARF